VATVVPPTNPTPRIVIGAQFASFRDGLCKAFATGDASSVINSLPYYLYNSGLRYGYLGDGEGQSADPSLLRTWLPGAHVRCDYFTPDVAGHALLLTSGWKLPGGPWSLLDLDIFQGHWKINDFTFGSQVNLFHAMHTAHPILSFHA
jgi:hypothetical protein